MNPECFGIIDPPFPRPANQSTVGLALIIQLSNYLLGYQCKSQTYFLPGFDSQGSYIGTLLMRLEIRILSILNHSQLNCSQPPVFERVLVQRRLEDERGEEMQRLVKH